MRGQRWIRLSLPAVLTALIWSGCGRPATNPTGESAAAPPAPMESTGDPLSDDEARAFGSSMESAVRSGEPARINALIDWDALVDTAMSGVSASKKARADFCAGVKQGLNQPSSLVGSLAAAMKQQRRGTFRLLRTRTLDKRRSALCRLIVPESGASYFDFILARRPDGQVRAVDIYVFIAGERLSQTIRRLYIPLVASASRSLIDRLTGEEQEFVKNFPTFQKFGEQVRDGQSKEALATYRQFPAGLQKDKSIMQMRLRAAQAVGDKEYEAFIEDFRRFHPHDAAVDFLSIDYYSFKKRYDDALACIDRLDKALGGDPYLNVLRGQKYGEAGALDRADKAFLTAIEQEPELADAYWDRVALSLEKKDFDTTAAVLTQIAERFGVTFDPKNELYAEFVKSSQYRSMTRAQSHGARPKMKEKAERPSTPQPPAQP